MEPNKVRCPECNGTGEFQDSEIIDICEVCNGDGWVDESPETED